MDRFRTKLACSLGGAFMLLALLITVTGCNVFATGLYVFQGHNNKAEYAELKGQRVAIVCRPPTSLQFGNASVSRDIARQLGVLLKNNVKNIKVIEQREVSDWTDENNWEDFVEIGKALNADRVLGVELEDFSLYQGQTLYQGKADLSFAVYDPKQGKEPLYEKKMPQALYPPTTAIPADKPVEQFRRQFVNMLAEQIARHFYDHDPTLDVASDSTALQ